MSENRAITLRGGPMDGQQLQHVGSTLRVAEQPPLRLTSDSSDAAEIEVRQGTYADTGQTIGQRSIFEWEGWS